ncbi:tumor protein p53-inducible nuclear protein 2 isoform X1 [Corvus moneduloides]|uniref:tumor protein p53-inducible nuclear protein 2 isoform X1 n=1 Tax=Corvus moneduloides TaxID=1196302 RepID=UPI0013639EDC|nr:tumor protein p53-inducible nuclear protein 2 isoform X1 [Corvus moneduloides]
MGVWAASSLCPFPSAGATTSPAPFLSPPRPRGAAGGTRLYRFFFQRLQLLIFVHLAPPAPAISLCRGSFLPRTPGVSALPLHPSTLGVSILSLLAPRPRRSPAPRRSLPGALPPPRPRGTEERNGTEPNRTGPRGPPGPRSPSPPRGGPRPPCARSHWLRRRGAEPLCDVTISCRKVPICAGERRALGRTAGSAAAPAPHRHRPGTAPAPPRHPHQRRLSAFRDPQGRPLH